MKRTWITGALAGAALLTFLIYQRGQSALYPPAAEPKEKRTISTNGSATVRVKPDSARVFFGIETLAKTVKEAREDNNKRAKAAGEALHALKVPNMRMKTSDVTVSLEKSHRREDRLPEILGYRVTHTFTVLVQDTDAEKLGATARTIMDTALEHGANIVEHISFFKQDDKAARREALAKAVEEALANAKALAGGAKVEVREPVSIHGQPEYNWGGRLQTFNVQVAPPAGGEAPLVAGDLLITCNVSVTCTY